MAKLADAVVDVAAAWRITRLITRDAILAGARDRVEEHERATKDAEAVRARYGDDVAAAGGPLTFLLSCPYCASVWVAAGVALARRLAPLQWDRAARVLAMSAAVCWLAERE